MSEIRKHPRLQSGVKQTDFTPNKGNALQACIATVLAVHLEDVPNFIAQDGDIYDFLRSFLATKGLGFMKITLNDEGCLPFAPGAATVGCLLAGQSPRGSHKHVVVAEIPPNSIKPVPVFDPHPSNDFLSTYIWVGLFVTLQPADFNKKIITRHVDADLPRPPNGPDVEQEDREST